MSHHRRIAALRDSDHAGARAAACALETLAVSVCDVDECVVDLERLRLGQLTASRIDAVQDAVRNYIRAVELLTGEVLDLMEQVVGDPCEPRGQAIAGSGAAVRS